MVAAVDEGEGAGYYGLDADSCGRTLVQPRSFGFSRRTFQCGDRDFPTGADAESVAGYNDLLPAADLCSELRVRVLEDMFPELFFRNTRCQCRSRRKLEGGVSLSSSIAAKVSHLPRQYR